MTLVISVTQHPSNEAMYDMINMQYPQTKAPPVPVAEPLSSFIKIHMPDSLNY